MIKAYKHIIPSVKTSPSCEQTVKTDRKDLRNVENII